ncbi:MAG: dNTP triphosphohydrolase [Bacteroidota bacterium]|nr:dNTP triphosphohydrolase [Bacteroidota bacterium]
MKERWNTLLNPRRFRETTSKRNVLDYRNAFENDYSRVILSPHVRRLQDKAQVFPMDKNDFIRTRLTHSVEVSTFAKGIGLGVENELIEHGKLDEKQRGSICSILATAGFIHDLGNPPFGHYGEESIQQFFRNEQNRSNYCKDFTTEEINDFTNFDGNVQGFRILRKLGLSSDGFSYNLTYPTLASVIKYPKSSIEGNKKESKKISYKKFGYFQSEKADFEEINNVLELNNNRHPLVFLLEAADDIAYSVSDIEDGCKKHIITEELLMDTMTTELKNTNCENFIGILDDIKKKIPSDFPQKLILLVQNFRIRVQSYMLLKATETFLDRHDTILSGEFDEDLILASEASALRKAFKKLSIYNFQHESVLKMELVGEAAMSFLLNKFISSVLSAKRDDPKTKESKFYELISPHYRYASKIDAYNNLNYKKIQLVLDYISGMTDSFALNLYHELSGQIIK